MFYLSQMTAVRPVKLYGSWEDPLWVRPVIKFSVHPLTDQFPQATYGLDW